VNLKNRLRLQTLAVFTLGATLAISGATLSAQVMEHSAPPVPSDHLVIHTFEGKTLILSPQELAGLPHKTITVFNEHSNANETYSGVPLADLLGKVGVPLGEKVRGRLFLIGIVAMGTDNYAVLYSLAEIDPSIHTGDVIVADMMNGQKLSSDGAFKMVSTEEKRPARWVRNLASITVVEVNP
jgi:hypothetical protein